MTTPVVMVTDIYDRPCYVAERDLDNSDKTQLPIYTRQGVKYTLTPTGARAFKKGEAVSIHRENIKVVFR